MGCCCSKSSSPDAFVSAPIMTNSASGKSLPSTVSDQYIPPTVPSSPEVSVGPSEAILFAANYCRDSPFQWHDEPLLHIGTRSHKWHFMVDGTDSESNKRSKFIMSIACLRDLVIPLSHATMMDIFSTLVCSSLCHPLIYPCEDIDYNKEKQLLIVVRKFTDKGSLRDVIHNKQNPRHAAREKYASSGKPLSEHRLKLYGRHILEALMALHLKGIICDTLSTGNILIDNGIARISELELTLLGHGMQPEIAELVYAFDAMHKEVVYDLQVLLFGFVLFEMATGQVMRTPHFDEELARLHRPIGVSGVVPILASIFDTQTATLASLLESPFFQDVPMNVQLSKIKLKSDEKSLVKTSMSALAKRRLHAIQKVTELEQQRETERTQERDDLEVFTEATSLVQQQSVRRGSDTTTLTRRKSRRRSTAAAASANTDRNHASPTATDDISTPLLQDDQEKPPEEDREVEITEKQNDELAQFRKMLQVGVPLAQVHHRMQMNGFDPNLISE